MKIKASTLKHLLFRFFSVILLLSVCLAPVINPSSASGAPLLMPPITVTVTNSTPIAITDNPGTASLYPSPINISGAVGTITNVTVRFNNLTISRPRDLDILLIGPTGQAFILMSDVAGSTDAAASSNVTITLQDGAGALPSDAVGTTLLTTGTFRPTNNGNGEGSLPAPAPAGPYNNPPAAPGGTVCTGCVSTFASVFAQPGVGANGQWRLYVDDDGTGGAVVTNQMAGGWTLSVTTDGVGPTAANVNVSGRVIDGKGRQIFGARVELIDPNGQPRTSKTNQFGYYRFTQVPAGGVYTITASAKGYQPTSLVRNVQDEVSDLDIVLQE